MSSTFTIELTKEVADYLLMALRSATISGSPQEVRLLLQRHEAAERAIVTARAPALAGSADGRSDECS